MLNFVKLHCVWKDLLIKEKLLLFVRHCVVAGKLFNNRGPETAKLLSPRAVRARGAAKHRLVAYEIACPVLASV